VGIAPEDQEKVFEEFKQVGTADKKVEGTSSRSPSLPKVHRAAQWADLGKEPTWRGLDIHLHAAGAPGGLKDTGGSVMGGWVGIVGEVGQIP